MDLETTLQKLASERPLFHSEADFQHALAWEMHREWPEYSIRLERRIPKAEGGLGYAFDVWATSSSRTLAMELKYKTRSLDYALRKEPYNLQNHGAQDLGRYDFLTDISRLESVASDRLNVTGCAVLLTNDPPYWRAPRIETTVDKDFRIHQDRRVTGRLAWSEGASEGTKKGREKPIVLRRSYDLKWRRYSAIDVARYGDFRYLLVQVTGGN